MSLVFETRSSQIPQSDTSTKAEPLELRDFLGLKEMVLAFFLLAGTFKAILSLEDFPIDLTVLAALLCGAFLVYGFSQHKERRFPLLFLVLGFFLAFAPTLLWTHWHDYAVEKASRFYTLTLFATVAPLYLVRTRNELRRFLCAFTLLSAVVTMTALISFLTVGKDVERLLVLSANPIGLARAVGVVFLFVTVCCFRTRARYTFFALSLIPLVVLFVAMGERGPILATALASIVIILVFELKRWRRMAQIAAFLFVAVGMIHFTRSWIPEISLFRVEAFFAGELGESELMRVDWVRFSLPKILEHPWGVGLGGFADLYGASSSAERVFPHNIVLETFLEGGWLAGLYLVVLSWRALRDSYLRALKESSHLEFRLLFCLLLFYLANELAGSELNDSKVTFAVISLCVGFGAATYEEAKSRTWPASRPHGQRNAMGCDN